MALTLYTHPLSRGRIARWMLEEVGEPYEARIIDYGPPMKGPEYRAINPMKVPALVHDGKVDRERRHPELPGRDLPAGRPHARGPRGLLALDVLRRGPARIRDRQPLAGLGGAARVPGPRGLRHLRGGDRDAGRPPEDPRLLLRRPLHGGGRGAGIADRLRPARRHHPSEPAFEAYWQRLFDRPAGARAREIDDRLVEERKAAHG